MIEQQCKSLKVPRPNGEGFSQASTRLSSHSVGNGKIGGTSVVYGVPAGNKSAELASIESLGFSEVSRGPFTASWYDRE